MSLLLEALKKAELAKQAAKEQPGAVGTPPFTRDKLPDISQPMEIHSDDLSLAESAPAPPAPERADKPALELALEETARAAPPPATPQRAAPAETDFMPPDEPEERKQAKQLFEVKEMDVNPRRPFYITLGVLGLFALGTVGYFWYQLQPRSFVSSTAVATKPTAAPIAAAPPLPAAPITAPTAPAAATVAPPTGQQPIAGKPDASARDKATVAAATAATAPGLAPARRGTAPTDAGASAQPRTPRRAGDISITPARVQPDPVLDGAYQSFNAGDLARSRGAYQQVLRDNPNSRDALLGLAAVEMQDRHYNAAESYYTRLLVLDPRDAYALAGLIGLRGDSDPQAAESRLKNMIAAQPEASFLHFSLGNQYAAQGRWPEAQQAYFRAFSGDPEHPDFAYNLAVSLDKMHQAKPALEYYRRALALAEGRPATFDRAQVSKRATQLER